jgi:hypothetical protein
MLIKAFWASKMNRLFECSVKLITDLQK